MDDEQIPENLIRMTKNIKNNGYSDKNKYSLIQNVATDTNKLDLILDLLEKHFFPLLIQDTTAFTAANANGVPATALSDSLIAFARSFSGGDSIIAIVRNQDLPLDTLKSAWPVADDANVAAPEDFALCEGSCEILNTAISGAGDNPVVQWRSVPPGFEKERIRLIAHSGAEAVTPAKWEFVFTGKLG